MRDELSVFSATAGTCLSHFSRFKSVKMCQDPFGHFWLGEDVTCKNDLRPDLNTRCSASLQQNLHD